jgi:putative tryptophan/tyrosine transport system substrate-binding protein
MRRREFIGLIGAAIMWPAAAQQRMPRLAIVHPSAPVTALNPDGPAQWRAFFGELERQGFAEGKSLEVLRYSGEGRTDHYAELAKEAVSRNPDIIFTVTPRMLQRLKGAGTKIPIVVSTSDPIAFGITSSLARPEGNITGVIPDAGIEINDKRLALLKELVPHATRFGYLVPRAAMALAVGRRVHDACQRMGVALIVAALETLIDQEYERAFALLAQERVDALLVASDAESLTHSRLIAELAAKGRLPAIYPYRGYMEAGGLMAYAVDLIDLYRHAAGQIAQLLKGARVSDVPFYQATTFELVINLKTAKTLGLTVPPTLLARADEVIE